MEGESTRIETDHLIAEEATSILHQAPERPYLRVERGKDKDKEFVLNPGETGVGRSIDNDVILTDIAVSRRHLTIVLSDAGLLKIVDLGSGNGSTVNGSRVREAPLNQGDRIELGETTLVVEIPGQQEPTGPVPGAPYPGVQPPAAVGLVGGDTTDQTASPAMPAATPTVGGLAGPTFPQNAATPVPTDYIAAPGGSAGPFGIPRPWLFAFLGVGGIIVALVGATITALVLRDGGESVDAGGHTAAFNAGIRAMDARRWDEAYEQMSLAAQENPGDHRTNELLQEIGRAREDAATVARAEAALAEDPPNASAALQALGAIQNDSRLIAQANVVQERATGVQVASLRAQALAAVEAGDERTARDHLDLLDVHAREVEAAQTAAAEVRAALGGDEGEQVASAGSTSRRPSSASTGRSPSSASSSSSSSSMSRGMAPSSRRGSGSPAAQARERVVALFRQRNFAGASRLATDLGNDMESSADQSRLVALAGLIRRFQGAYRAASASGATPAQMATAIRLEEEIVVTDAALTRSIKSRLVSTYLQNARRNLDRNPASACRDVARALAVDRSDGDAARLTRECQSKAEQLMNQADALRATNPARARTLYGQVHAMLPRGNALRERAYLAQNAIRPSGGRDEDE